MRRLGRLASENSAARRLKVVKSLGRTKLDRGDITELVRLYRGESSSLVKREIISAIGRQRRQENIDVLIGLSRDDDPKLILQALRGLAYFKDNPDVRRRVGALRRHKNEIVQEYTRSRFVRRTPPPVMLTRNAVRRRPESIRIVSYTATPWVP